MVDRTGQQLGNYQLMRLLGKGAFADVYLGQHRFLSQRQVAIKILAVRLDTHDGTEFQREANQLAALKHPHIVSLLDFSVEGMIPYLVMDYCPGGTLRQRHPRGTRLPLPQVVNYVEQMAQALDYAHAQRIIHRDVKPENMLIGQNGEILLSDFGVATVAHATVSMHTQIPSGTVLYMAPEQIQAQARPASDQYALAVAAYAWLAGEYPFEGSSSEVIGKQLTAPPPPLRALLPDLPPAVEAVVLTALAKNPQERFATTRSFAQALAQAANPAISSFQVHSDAPVSLLDLSGPTIPASIMSTPPARPDTPRTPQQIASGRTAETISEAGIQAFPSNRVPWQEEQAWQPVLTPPAPARRGFLRTLILAGVLVLLLAGAITGVFASGVLGQRPTPAVTSTPTSSPSQLAQAVIQRYYNDINQRNYQDAYQLWGSSYQSQQTYDQFTAGYANTLRDAITIVQVTPQSDGTVQVQMTINATEQGTSGNVTKVFQGYYTVGQEQGAWKLLSAHFQQTSKENTHPKALDSVRKNMLS